MKRAAAFFILTSAAVGAVTVGRGSRDAAVHGAPSYRQMGPASAPVTLAVFSDFQCPNCAKTDPWLKEFLAQHPGKARLVFRHHPLRMHRWSIPAAQAAEAAGLQGKFWEYAAVLYERQKDWGESPDPAAAFTAYARDLGLDLDRFLRDREDPRRAAFIMADARAAKSLGVNSTPTVFIGGRRLVGLSQLKESAERYFQLEGGS